MELRKLNIITLNVLPFPYGFAPTNRLLSYLIGMGDLGNSVKVICLFPKGNPNKVKNKRVKGIYKGIEYEYMYKSTISPENKFKKLFVRIRGVLNAITHLYKLKKQKKIDVILMGLTDSITIFIFYLFSRIFHIKFIHERTEYPFVFHAKSIIKRIDKYVYLNYIIKLFDGIFVPTKVLYKYFKQKVSQRTKIALIPGMVKPGKFINNTCKVNESSKYIAYCGDMGNNKDGVPILIEAFKKIREKHNDIKLYLIGDTSDKAVMEALKRKVADYDLKDRIVFTGRIDHDKMPAYLCNATLLALARPANKQAEGGFPSKLLEYLETGKPVVITKVGEIPEYLTDGVNAFLSEPDSAEAFAEKLDYALSNPDMAKNIGLNGQKLIFDKFDYKIQSKKLVDFIREL